jgi:hypothetical protein
MIPNRFFLERAISGEIFNLRTTARGKCTGGPARACLAAGAKSLVGFCYFLFARHRDDGHGDATMFEAKAMHFHMDQPQGMAVFTFQTWGGEFWLP